MKIEKGKLLGALEAVKPALATKELIEQSTCFAFIDGAVSSYNDIISIRYPLEIDLEGAIDSAVFYQLIQKITPDKDGNVTLEFDEAKSHIKVKGKGTKSGLKLDKEIKLPLKEELGEITDEDWITLPDNFITALKFCMFTVGRDMSKPLLTCLNITGDYIESCDNQRFTRYQVDGKGAFDESLIIPGVAIRSMVNYDLVDYKKPEGTGWIHFRTAGNLIFSTRVYDDQYPDLTELYEVEGSQIKFPTGIDTALDRAGLFSKADHDIDNEVEVEIQDKKLRVKVEGQTGWIEEELPVRYTGEKIAFVTNPNFLIEILKQVDTAIVGNKLKFTGKNWEHVIPLFKD